MDNNIKEDKKMNNIKEIVKELFGINEVWFENKGVGTTIHLNDKPKIKNKPINLNNLTRIRLEELKEKYKEYIEKYKLQIDNIEDTLRIKNRKT